MLEKIEESLCVGCGVPLVDGDIEEQLTGICNECYAAHLAMLPEEKPLDLATCPRKDLVDRIMYLETKVDQWKHYVKKYVYNVED